MTDSEEKLITVTCPECGEKRFSFSANAISEKNGIQFVCTLCSSTVQISRTHEGDLFVQCLM